MQHALLDRCTTYCRTHSAAAQAVDLAKTPGGSFLTPFQLTRTNDQMVLE